MEINVKDNIKLVEIWLSHEDQENQEVLEKVQDTIQQYRETKYKTAVYYSGSKDLLTCTEGLLRNNIR